MKNVRVFVLVVLFCLVAITSVNATETAWKPVDSWLDMQTLQWKWAVESIAGEFAPENSWALSFYYDHFDTIATGPFSHNQYLHVYRFKDYSTRFGVPSSGITITNVAIKMTRISYDGLNGGGMMDCHMYLMKGATVGSSDKAGLYDLNPPTPDPNRWPATWNTVTYSFTPAQWGLSLSPSDLPNLGFKLSAKGYNLGAPNGWSAAAKCYPSDWPIAVKITYTTP